MSRQIFPSDKTPDVRGFKVIDPVDRAGEGKILQFDLEDPDGKVSRILKKEPEVSDLIERLNAWLQGH